MQSNRQTSEAGPVAAPGPTAASQLRAIRRSWLLILVVVALCTAVSVAFSLSHAKEYDATADLLLRSEQPSSAPLRADDVDPERALNTAVQLIETSGTVHEVRRRLRLDRTADELLDQISAETQTDSDVVSITARDEDARTAAEIANAFADSFVRFRLDQARQRYESAAQLAEQQILALSPEEQAGAQGRTLRARRDDLRITAALQTGGAQVVRRASIPTDPARPRPVLAGILGLGLGLVLGLVGALLLDLLDRRVRDEAGVEELFGLPLIGAIPRRSRRGAIAEREAYGLLAANLRVAGRADGPQVIVVTSASPAEGKTSVTFGLAGAFATMGLSVIAVEADLRRPAFERRAHLLPTNRGLNGVLAGTTDLLDVLVELDAETHQPASPGVTDQGTFRVLPAGALPGNPQRVLSGSAVGRLLNSTRDLADVVLVDTAPIGTVNDAIPLLDRADTLVLVARLNVTTRDAARRVLRLLRDAHVAVAGVVVTNSDRVGGDGYYRHRDDREHPPARPREASDA